MHAFSSLVVWHEDGSAADVSGLDERLDPERHRVERVVDVEHVRAGGQTELRAQHVDAADPQKQGCN